MKNTNKMKYSLYGSMLAIAFVMVLAVPAPAHAFDAGRLIDPLCLFACDDTPQTVTYTNSNNVNSNVNSPGASVTVGGPVATPVVTTPSNNNYNYNYSYNSPQPRYEVVYQSNPIAYNSVPYYSYYNTPYYYQTPTYPNYNYYPSLSVSCSVNTTYAPLGTTVVWNAYVSGGSGSYSYRWSGTDNLYGSNQSAYYSYSYPGQKYAVVTVYSGNQQVSQNCSNSVNVASPIVQYPYPTSYPVAYPDVSNTLDVACFSDPSSIRVNQPTTWSAEVTGGIAPYTYSWTGSDGLNGNDRSVLKYYNTTGDKNAVVTIRSADGRTGTRACSNTVTVRSATITPAPTRPVTPPQVEQPTGDNGLSASALFSLKNVPWGLVGILVILVLFFTVVYLLFNRTKI